MGTNGKTRVMVVLKQMDHTQLSASDIVRRIDRLCSDFSVTILTGTPSECRRLFPKSRVLGIREAPLRNREIPFLMLCWMALPILRYDAILVADVISLPAILTLTKGPVVCYGNTHPIQHVIARSKKKSALVRLTVGVYRWMLASALRKCHLITAISPQLAAVYESYGVEPESMKVIEVGVPIETFTPPRDAKRTPSHEVKTGVYHGTVSFERGLSIILEGTKIAAEKRRDFRIKLVGCRESNIALVRELIVGAGLSDIVEPIPVVSHTEIPRILWSADWGISLLEPNVYFAASPPVKVLEFLAAGLPVVANKIATHALYLEDGVNSLLIPYEPLAFAKATLDLVEDDKLRKRLSENALEGVQRFNDKESINRLIEEIRELTGRSPGNKRNPKP